MKKKQFVAVLSLLAWLLAQCGGQLLPFKAANLGGWLVTEGWMTPSLFDGIPNKDLLVRVLRVYLCVVILILIDLICLELWEI